MSLSCMSSLKLAVAGLCCLLTTVALAQQGQSGAQRESSQSGSSASNSGTSGQSGRSSAAQSGQSSSQQSTAAQPGQRYTANYGGTQGNAGRQGQEVDQFFANCLLADNRAEVELSQLAEKQAKSSEVKEFAQMMVRDHGKMIQQLEQVAGSQGASSRGTSGSSTSSSSNENADSNTISASGTSNVGGLSSTGTSSADTNSSGLPGSSGAGQTASRNATAATSGSDASSLTAGQSASGGEGIQQIAQIDRQIVDRKSQMIKEDLQQKSGTEFDKCFMSTAVAAHVHALAALEVIGQQSQGQLAQVAKQAQPIVQQHLDHAKQLAKQLDSQSSSGSGSTAERSTSRTER